MNKALGGCLAAALVLVVGAGIAGYYLVWKPAAHVAGVAIDAARETVGKVGEMAETIERMRALEEGIVAQGPYVPPADGRLSEAQVQGLVAVEAAVAAALGPQAGGIAAATEAAAAGAAAGAHAVPWRDALAALARLGSVGIAAKTAQVEALNAAQLSLAEYQWIRDTGIRALIAGGVMTAGAQAGQAAAAAGEAAEAARILGEAAREAVRVAAREAAGASGGATPAPAGEPPGAPPAAVPATPPAPASAAPTPLDSETERANFERVRPHAEAFVRARVLAGIGL
jgi:hypothetical protein